MAINLQEIQELLTAVAQTTITEFELKTDEFELKISQGTAIAPLPVASSEAIAFTTPAPAMVSQPTPPATAPTESPASSKSTIDDKWVAITSPMVGTFYRAPAPGEDPFVSIGDQVGTGQTVCIIEAMKLMNEIEAEVSGQVMKIEVEDGEPIEYGQALMWVNPA